MMSLRMESRNSGIFLLLFFNEITESIKSDTGRAYEVRV